MLIVIVLCLMLMGCGQQKTIAIDTSQSEVSTEFDFGEVSLSDISPPSFREDFATLTINDSSMVVYWGDGVNNVMWKESGYPGFGYPMIIETSADFKKGTRALLVTQWGQYEYEFVTDGEAFIENSNLICSETGKCVMHWGVMEEFLILWSNQTHKYEMFKLVGGTEIVP